MSADLPSFSALQAALSKGDSQHLIYFAFDLLFLGKEDLRGQPLSLRKARLKPLLEKLGDTSIRYVEHFEASAASVLESARNMNLEGLISKKLDAPYVSSRSGYWTKTKIRPGQEVVLAGWTSEQGSVRSLLAGVYRDGRLEYVGRIGTGFGREAARGLEAQLKLLTVAKSPFAGGDAPRAEKNVRWLKPTLVAEIEFAGWTDSRHDSPSRI